MVMTSRFALLAVALAVSTSLWATPYLALVSNGVGVTGHPVALAGTIDVDQNGRPELLVAGGSHLSFVEEDDNPRGYREVLRLPSLASPVQGALLVEVPGVPTRLLLHGGQRIELRDMATLEVTASLDEQFDTPVVGDVDGDGRPELAISHGGYVSLLDPVTLETVDTLDIASQRIAIADIVGDARQEIISSDARAYAVTGSVGSMSATEVWNANIAGQWKPYAVDVDGHAAVVLYGIGSAGAQLATFGPTPALRTLVPAEDGGVAAVFANVNADGKVDLISATISDLRAIDIASGATLWDTANQQFEFGWIDSPVAIDLDGDGASELAWSNTWSYDSGIVAMSLPPTGVPRWRADFLESKVLDWALIRRSPGAISLGYLTHATQELPRLGRIGFINGATFSDEGGSAFSWLPGYDAITQRVAQHAMTALPGDGAADTLVVAGVQSPPGGEPFARWLWTFDANGVLQSARSLVSSTEPQRIAAAQILDRPERQLVVAGWMPLGGSGPLVRSAIVDIVDVDTGALLWQSVPLPTDDTAWLTKLQVADIDADGHLDIVVAYGVDVAVLKPSAGTSIVRNYAAQSFSLLERGAGQPATFATLDGANVAVYDGLSTTPEKTFVLPDDASTIALFNHGPEGALMFATAGYPSGLVVRWYATGGIVASRQADPGSALFAGDIDGDGRAEIIVSGGQSEFAVRRLENDETIFRDGFDGTGFGK